MQKVLYIKKIRVMQKVRWAFAQEPSTQKIKYGWGFRIATINVKGMKMQGKREEIEKWMKDNEIRIAVIQETRIAQNAREARKEYTWYFSGENPIMAGYTAGVAIVIDNKLIKHIVDIEPINDRAMYIILKAAIQLTIITTHIPQAMRTEEEKKKVYDSTKIQIRKNKNKGPVLVMGTLTQEYRAQNQRERRHIGENTFEPETAIIYNRSEEIKENRELLIQFCEDFDMKLMNTFF